MRLLPRSPGRTWALATTAWAATCALAWVAVPLWPRAEWAVDGPVLPVGFVPGRHTLLAGPVADAAAGTLSALRAFDADAGTVTDWFPADAAVRLQATALSPDGRWAAVAHGPPGRQQLDLFDAAAGRGVAVLPHAADAELTAACFSADGRRLAYAAAGRDGGCVHVWDVEVGAELRTVRPAGGRLAFAPDGRTLAVADDPGPGGPAPLRLRVWDVGDGRLLREWVGPAGRGCGHLRFAPDGRGLVAVFWAWDQTTFPNPGRIAARLPWGFTAQVCGYSLATGNEMIILGCDHVLLPPGESWFATQTYPPPPTGNITWDVWGDDGCPEPGGSDLGHVTRLIPNGYGLELFPEGSGLDGRLVAAESVTYGPAVWQWLARLGIRLPAADVQTGTTRFVDARTGRTVGGLPAYPVGGLDGDRGPHWVTFSSAGDVAAVSQNWHVRVWDVPPRKPLTWFLAAAVLLAVPPAWLARRRVRRLRRGVA